jgi:hypothetical protein
MERHTLDQRLVGVDANGAPDLQSDRATVSESARPFRATSAAYMPAQVYLGHRNDLYGPPLPALLLRPAP